MYATKKTANSRRAFTLVELLVVIAIILAISALAAAFAPRVSDSQKLTRAVDQLEQWLLTAKMRAKRDGLATGIRFIGNPTGYAQFQYIQQPSPLVGGSMTATGPTMLLSANVPLPATGLVTFNTNVDFSLGGLPANQWLVQLGDYLQVNDGGVYSIGAASGPTTLQLSGTPYDLALSISTPTTNYRIIRQPRILIGEDPLVLPNNYAVNGNLIPDAIIPFNSTTMKIPWSNVAPGPSGYPEILFSPTGAVIGTNAGSSKILISVFDTTMNFTDVNDFMNHVGIVAVQSRTGYIGAYSAAQGAGIVGYDPFYFAEIGRGSGL